MHVSMVELKACLRRCFEASGYFVGNYEDAANMILWLEKHGLNGLAELNRTLPYIYQDQDKEGSTIIYEDSTAAVIDSHNRSALNCIAAAVDLAHAKALENGIATVTVHNCHNRMFVLKALTDCGRRGVSVVAYWKNGTDSITEYTAAIKAGHRYPSFHEGQTNMSSDSTHKQTLTIICSSRVDLTSSLQHAKTNVNGTSMDAQQVELNKEKSVEFGIEINEALWRQINKIGEGVLVESSQQSRMGAG